MPPKSTNYKLLTTNWRLWRRGFTLVELLVVVTIISILISVAYVSFNVAQNKSRDSRRKQELKAISSTLVSYYQDNDIYPGNLSTDYTSSSADWIPSLTPNYIQKLPTETKTGNYYLYRLVGLAKKDFQLWATLDNPNDHDAVGQPTATCNLPPPSPAYNFCMESPR